MKKITVFICFFTLLTAIRTYAQWTPFGAGGTGLTATRTGLTGVGFNLTTDVDAAAGTSGAKLLVQDGILGHYVSGTVGSFSSGSRWLGLGIGNPGNIPEPYGLAIADSAKLGFYNIISEVFGATTRKNLIAGFGANGTNRNRFIVRGYSGTNGATGKDLLVANPEGGIGVNAEPQSCLWVDSIDTYLSTDFKTLSYDYILHLGGGKDCITIINAYFCFALQCQRPFRKQSIPTMKHLSALLYRFAAVFI